MCLVRAWFIDLREVDGGQVLLGNNKSCKIRGIGSVCIRNFDGSVRTLTEVRYIPDLKRNLISLGMLDSSGYSFKSEPSILKIVKGSYSYTER